jgi:hypothetical protein
MANCNAKVGGTTCGGVLYRCPKCGLTGCKNRRNGETCPNNITRDSGGTCRNCGSNLQTI